MVKKPIKHIVKKISTKNSNKEQKFIVNLLPLDPSDPAMEALFSRNKYKVNFIFSSWLSQ